MGISPRPDWTKVYQRLVDLLRLKSPSRDKLIAAIAEGDGDVAALRAQAYAEATVVPAINHAVIAGAHNKLVQLYSGHARANHKKLADQFNSAAKEFAAAAAIADPERDATAMVDEDEASRSAWLSDAPGRRATRCSRSGAAGSS